MRQQRAGDAENPVEMQDGKWTVEGEVKDVSRVSETQAGVSGRKCVGIFERVGLINQIN